MWSRFYEEFAALQSLDGAHHVQLFLLQPLATSEGRKKVELSNFGMKVAYDQIVLAWWSD